MLEFDIDEQNARPDLFVYAPERTCSAFWTPWPAQQEKSVSDGTVIVYDVAPTVGNLFRYLADIARVSARSLIIAGVVVGMERSSGTGLPRSITFSYQLNT